MRTRARVWSASTQRSAHEGGSETARDRRAQEKAQRRDSTRTNNSITNITIYMMTYIYERMYEGRVTRTIYIGKISNKYMLLFRAGDRSAHQTSTRCGTQMWCVLLVGLPAIALHHIARSNNQEDLANAAAHSPRVFKDLSANADKPSFVLSALCVRIHKSDG